MNITENEAIIRCLRCGICIDKCPILSTKKNTTDSSLLVADILDTLNGGPCTRKTQEIVWACMACGQCRQWCPEKIAPDIFAAARRELLNRRLAPIDRLKEWLPDSPYHFGRVIPTLVLGEEPPWRSEPATTACATDVVIYLGCYALAIPEIPITLSRLVEQMGMSVISIGGNGLCCGAAYILNGKLSLAQDARKRSAETIISYGPRQVVFLCASCHALISPLLSQIKSSHHVAFLLQNISRLKLQSLGKRTITYHDPCDPRRGISGDYETPRRLLSILPDVTVVEMKHNRENSLCCGGLANTTDHRATERIRLDRLREAKATGAEMMVTTCQSCYGAMIGFDEGMPKVTHDVLLVGQYTGITTPEYFRNLVNTADLSSLLSRLDKQPAKQHLDPAQVLHTLDRFIRRHRPYSIR